MEKVDILHGNVYFGFFKQGDDLIGHFEETDNAKNAFDKFNLQMLQVADHANRIAEFLSKHSEEEMSKVELNGGAHYISITGPTEIIQGLIDAKLVELDEFYYDELDDEENYEEEGLE